MMFWRILEAMQEDRTRSPKSLYDLQEHIADEWPELWDKIKDEPISDQEILNEFTGLDVKDTDLVEDGSERFLERLKEMKANAS